ncbi:uncharacterized protein LOC133015075 [Limanda limanda]|uniref:uncharacterized protein LOC133015075 n=1 Tax=Limanda limanda TaxID=27771 RepID=UPI0029C7B8B3|nr:uncharacterized protein LOC133015075 [Limanda limanda]
MRIPAFSPFCQADWDSLPQEKRLPAWHSSIDWEAALYSSRYTFWSKWNFPNCLGAIDGKHVGDYGRCSDGGAYSDSDLGKGMEAKTLEVPADCPLPGSDQQHCVPFTMVGDAAFPLKKYLMRPFPGKHLPRWRSIFIYRLSRARMVVECAFGILAARWRVLYTRINMKPDNVDSVIMAVCILHNYLLNPSESQRWLDEAEERGEHLQDARNMGGNRGSREAYDVREKLCAFFNSPEGRVSWQDRML